jgi:hypothetical protein
MLSPLLSALRIAIAFAFLVTTGSCESPMDKTETISIPLLGQWKSNMLTYGNLHAEDAEYPIPVDDVSEAHVWYYDGARVYYQIADYTGDDKWIHIAETVNAVYRDYVFATGSVPGWRIFPHGLLMHYQRTGDPKSKEAALLLANTSKFAATGGGPHEALSRETAYCIDAWLVAETLGDPRNPNLKQAVDWALGHIDQWFVQDSSDNWAPFMFGLTCETLIDYHEQVDEDPRILPAIKLGLDACWERAWVEEDDAFWYRADNPVEGSGTLNPLIAPAYAWVYLKTGDVLYRDRGDRVFAGGVKGAWLEGGKQYSQSYRWSFDYVEWRTEADHRWSTQSGP